MRSRPYSHEYICTSNSLRKCCHLILYYTLLFYNMWIERVCITLLFCYVHWYISGSVVVAGICQICFQKATIKNNHKFTFMFYFPPIFCCHICLERRKFKCILLLGQFLGILGQSEKFIFTSFQYLRQQKYKLSLKNSHKN